MNPSVAAELARQVLADETALAEYEIGEMQVPPEVAAVIDEALRRRYGADYHSPDDVTVIRA